MQKCNIIKEWNFMQYKKQIYSAANIKSIATHDSEVRQLRKAPRDTRLAPIPNIGLKFLLHGGSKKRRIP